MKKFVAVISILALLFCLVSAFAEGIDLKSLSDADLNELMSNVLAEIGTRQLYTEDMYWPDVYECGKDFEPGNYIVEMVGKSDPSKDYGFIYGWNSMDDYSSRDTDLLCFMERIEIGSTRKYAFEYGNILIVDQAICCLVRAN